MPSPNRSFKLVIIACSVLLLFLFFKQSKETPSPSLPEPPRPCECVFDVDAYKCPDCYCESNQCSPCVCEGVPPQVVPVPSLEVSQLQERYLNLLRDTLTGYAFQTTELAVVPSKEFRTTPFNKENRRMGFDWPYIGISMIGIMRMDNIRAALDSVTSKGVAGDFVECGVWRGGASIFAAGFLKIKGITDRNVWVVDSFGGLPPARTENDDNEWTELGYLSVSLDTVKTNFESFGLLGTNVQFVKGYFVDSLPTIRVKKIAVMRMDGDMYESTMDQFFNLYEKVSIGGWVIIDDWNIWVCRKAVEDFRGWHGIREEIVVIDSSSVYWIKQKVVEVDISKYTPLLTKQS